MKIQDAILDIEAVELAQAVADVADAAASDKLAAAQLAKDATSAHRASVTLARKNALHALINAAQDELADIFPQGA